MTSVLSFEPDLLLLLSALSFLNQLFFHVGTWLRLEDLTRKYAVKYDTIHVISGAIFDEDNNGKVDGVGEEKKLVTIAIQNR